LMDSKQFIIFRNRDVRHDLTSRVRGGYHGDIADWE